MGAVENIAPTAAPATPVSSAKATPLVALLGNPNCGKTALFNRLTGARQKVANYAGVTIERKEGAFISPAGRAFRVRAGETAPDVIVCVVDATNLRLNLRLVLEIQRLGLPMVLALNMVDVAKKRGIVIDADKLAAELGMVVVETVAVQGGGEKPLLRALDAMLPLPTAAATVRPLSAIDAVSVEETQREVRRILSVVSNDT